VLYKGEQMTDKQLKKLSRSQLLEILVEQGKKIEELEQQLEITQKQLADRIIRIENAGSIAQAALVLNDIFEKAQQAADLYLENIMKSSAGTKATENCGTNGNQDEK